MNDEEVQSQHGNEEERGAKSDRDKVFDSKEESPKRRDSTDMEDKFEFSPLRLMLPNCSLRSGPKYIDMPRFAEAVKLPDQEVLQLLTELETS